jgi:GTP-binding protein HflX
LSDTVGFITDLPTHLVEAFRATLEEVQEADVILHVRDATHPESRLQRDAVMGVLADLGIDADDERLIEVLNKIDRLPQEERRNLRDFSARASWDAGHAPAALEGVRPEAPSGIVAVSALMGEGVDNLLERLDDKLAAKGAVYDIELPLANGAALAWLHAHGKILKKSATKTKTRLKIALAVADYGRYQSRFGKTER